jgi:50S ribosome-binding GTPase
VAATFSIETSTLAAGAIGIVRLASDDLDATLVSLGLAPVAPGSVVLADLLGVDRGLIARYSETAADLMVHGGRGVVAAMAAALATHNIKEGASGNPVPLTSPLVSALDANAEARSVRGEAEGGLGDGKEGPVPLTGPPVSASDKFETPSSPPPPPAGEVAGVLDSRRGSPEKPLAPASTPAPGRRPPPTSKTRPPPPLETGEERTNTWPEAADAIEAAMLEALAHAASPRAIPVLLAQPARHREAPTGPFADAAALAHLLAPPLVVITGAPNIGKSSLLNALVGRQAAIVADEPGTTRDAVAAHAVVDGLTIRLVDAPGMVDRAAGSHPPLGEGSPIEPDPLIRAATTIAEGLIAAADLILVCRDAGAAEPAAATPPAIKEESLPAALAVATRCDLAPARPSTALAVSATTGEGLDAIAVAIRTTLVPDAALTDERPWRFAAITE